MPDAESGKTLSESSPSVQTHLGILQGVIERMAANSSATKAWCTTIVSAILVVVADKSKADYVSLALIPTLLFLALDVYYLAMEKGFRNGYNAFVKKVHDGSMTPVDLFWVTPRGNRWALRWEAFRSFSVWGFYLAVVIMILLAMQFVFA
jgi:hypothetical protein